MSKPRKVIRSKSSIYKKRGRPKWLGTVLFILFLFILVGLGYVVGREWLTRFVPGGGLPAISQPQSSEAEPSSAPSEPEEQEPVSSEPEPPAQQESIRAFVMSPEDMRLAGEALTAYFSERKTDGYNAVCFVLKTDEGVIPYQTENAMAAEYGAVSPSPVDLGALAAAAKDAGLVPMGRLSALKDPLAPHVSRENSYGYNNSAEVNWLDDSLANGGKPWLNPYMKKAREYISSLCAEAAGKGVEVIILTNVTFPTKNPTVSMGTINPFTSKEEILGQLVEECRTASGVTVYAGYDAAMLRLYGLSCVQGLGDHLAPVLDMSAIEAQREALTAVLTPSSEQPMSAEEIAAMLLGEDAAVRKAGGSRLPLIPQKDVPALAPLLAIGGYDSSVVY